MMPATRKTDSRRQRWRNATRELRRQWIMDHAMALLDERGLAAVTMRAVAARLGIGTMTLYSYFPNQDQLRQAMVQTGFDLMHERCASASTLDTLEGWRGGARSYIRFAREHPNLYKLMFDQPLENIDGFQTIMSLGFTRLVEKVQSRITDAGGQQDVERQSRILAGRFWIALHGLASLAIANRLGILQRDLDDLLEDILQCVAPN